MFRRNRLAIVALWTIITSLMLSNDAMAYIGPGGGMEFFGYAMWLIAMMGAAFLSVILWPFYKVLAWLRGSKPHAPAEQSPVTTAAADASPTPSPLAPLDSEQTRPPAPSVL